MVNSNKSKQEKENEYIPTFEGILTNGQKFDAEDAINGSQEYIFQNVRLYNPKDQEEIIAHYTEMYLVKAHVFYVGYSGEAIERKVEVINGRQ